MAVRGGSAQSAESDPSLADRAEKLPETNSQKQPGDAHAPKKSQKATSLLDFSSKSASAMAGASKQADLLRKRRETRSSGAADCQSDDGETPPRITPRTSSPRFPNARGETADISAIKDTMEGLRQLLLDNVRALEAMSDRVISHLDAGFDRQVADLNQKVLDAWAWQLTSNGNSLELDSGHPSIVPGPSKTNCKKPGFQVQHTPLPRAPVISPTTSPQGTNESVGHHLQSKQTKESLQTTTSSFSFINVLEHAAKNRSKVAQMIWLYLEDPRFFAGGQSYVRLLILIILASCCLNIVQTVESPPLGSTAEAILDYTVDCILSAEIIVRFIVCPNWLSFWTYGLNLLDLFTGPLTLMARIALPLFFPDDVGEDGTASVLLKSWLPMGQLLRLIRRFEGSYLIYVAFKNASEALPVMLYVLLLIIMTFASILYFVEPRSNIGSLPDSLWFTIVSLGTVGYGDVTPETPEGKAVTCVLVIVSALYMAMPLGIVGKVFSEVWDDRKRLLLTQLARQRFKNLGYTAKDIPAFFLSADEDKDGHLDMKEFTTMMKALQFDLSGERAAALFEVFDVDGGGTIDDQEFLSTLYPDFASKIYGEGDVSGSLGDSERISN